MALLRTRLTFFLSHAQTLIGVACDLMLDQVPRAMESVTEWRWFHRFSLISRTVDALQHRRQLPQDFLEEVMTKLTDLSGQGQSSPDSGEGGSGVHGFVDPQLFGTEQDRQLVQWIQKKPEAWAQAWPGSGGKIWGWGHNNRGQLGGVEGSKVSA